MSYLQTLYNDLVVHGDDLTEPSQASVEQVTVSSPALGDTRSAVRLASFREGSVEPDPRGLPALAVLSLGRVWAGSLGRVCV